MADLPYRRVLLKMSGEVLAGGHSFGIDSAIVSGLARQVKSVVEKNLEVAIVIGGGNFFRGISASKEGMDRVSADYLGMLGTVMNSVAFQNALERIGLTTRVLSAIAIAQLAEPYIRRRALRHLEKGRVVICAGGTGNPYFSTDTAAVLRAIELSADVIMKGTKVDGVFSADPAKDPGATRHDLLTYEEVIEKKLRVMDLTAVTLCMENRLPIRVFNIQQDGNMLRAASGEPVGTIVGEAHHD